MGQILNIILLSLLPLPLFSWESEKIFQSDFEYYREQNNREIRLSEYKDNDEALKIKLRQVEIINNSRKRFKADPVKLDILASRVANKMCREAAENDFIGHWNIAGEKPYHRYAFAGGHDHVSENAFGEWSSDDYIISDSNISSMMVSGHNTFMAEKAPYDGHKKTIINKSHNFVGIGFYLSGNQFRYYEEFIDRYLEFENIPSEVKVDEPCIITVKTNGEKFLYFLLIYHERFPNPLTASQLKRKGSYSDYTDEVYLKSASWDLASYRDGSTYKIPLSFSKEGLYYIHLFHDEKEILKASSLNTKGKTSASGIVIKVNR